MRKIISIFLLLIIALFRNQAAMLQAYGTSKRPALGRPFALGSLYDASRDRLVPGLTLWDTETLEDNADTKLAPRIDSKVITGSSFAQKAQHFDLDAQIKANFLAGLINVYGAAKYLKSSSSSSREAEVTFKYHIETQHRKLTMGALANIDYPQVFERNTGATHAVTEITYGADATFRFHKETRNEQEKEQLQKHLKAQVDLAFMRESGQATMDMNVSRISCEFNGDVNLTKPPTTFLDAVQAYESLPKLINTTTAMPMVIYLTPLSQLNNASPQLLQDISETVLTEVSLRFEKYDNIMFGIGDLHKTEAHSKLPLFRAHTNEFSAAVNVHKSNFRNELSHTLPAVRRGEKSEVELVNILHQSIEACEISALEHFVSSKMREAGALKEVLTWSPEALVTKVGAVEELLYADDHQYILLFTLQLYARNDQFTQCVWHNCGVNSTNTVYCSKNNCIQHREYKSWIHNQTTRYILHKEFSNYKLLAEHNPQNQNGSTLMIIQEKPKVTITKPILIEMYHDGRLISANLQLPTISGIEATENCTGTMVQWNVSYGQSFSELFTNKYLIYYHYYGTMSVAVATGNQAFISEIGVTEVTVVLISSFGIAASHQQELTNFKQEKHNCSNGRNIILLIGGKGTHASPSMEVYNPNKPDSNYKLDAILGIPRYAHSSVLFSGSILTMGGYSSSGSLSRNAELFTPEEHSTLFLSSLNHVRPHAGAAVLDNVPYICGGHSGGSMRLKSCERYRVRVWQSVASMNTARSNFAMVTFKGKLYGIGGNTGSYALPSVERYTPNMDKWDAVGSMHRGRYNHAAAVLGNRLYAWWRNGQHGL